jgi:hypothetical protein
MNTNPIFVSTIKKKNIMTNFKEEINQLALFAKRINFDVVNGCMLELTRLWLEDNKKMYNVIEYNIDDAKRIIKSLI